MKWNYYNFKGEKNTTSGQTLNNRKAACVAQMSLGPQDYCLNLSPRTFWKYTLYAFI